MDKKKTYGVVVVACAAVIGAVALMKFSDTAPLSRLGALVAPCGAVPSLVQARERSCT